MNKSGMRFLSSVLVMFFCGTAGVSAAPSVKMLGSNTARVGTNAAVVKADTNTAATQRLGSIRPKTVTTVAPVSVNKVVTKTSTEGSANDARLSLGKYIHSTGSAAGTIKPTTTAAPSASSSEFTALADRVYTLEGNVETLGTSVQSKQAVLSPGDGVTLENNTIAVDENISGLPNRMDELETRISGYVDEIDDLLEEHGITGAPAYKSITDEQTVYDSINIADEFEDDFDFADEFDDDFDFGG